MKKLAFALLALLALAGCKQKAAPLDNQAFSLTVAGQPTTLYTLTNANGMTAQISNYGARIVGLWVPDRGGNMVDVVLGHPTLDGYLAGDSQWDGAILGRYAGRLTRAQLKIDTATYLLDANDGENQLNGGAEGFHTRVWQAVEGRDADGNPTLKLTYTSPAGEMGYPGTLSAAVTYTLLANNALSIDMEATTDTTTFVNLSNRVDINLHGTDSDQSATTHALRTHAHRYVQMTEDGTPTGRLEMITEGSEMDFSNFRRIGGETLDQTISLSKMTNGESEIAASFFEPENGILMDVMTTQPALRLANNGKYITIEATAMPDAPRFTRFPSTQLLAGQTYKKNITYAFTTRK